VQAARRRDGEAWTEVGLEPALDELASRLREAKGAAAFVATPQATNEDLYAFRLLADAVGGLLDFRVGDPQEKVRVREDKILLRADRNPNTQGCLDLQMGRSGLAEILRACGSGSVKALVLQGPELLSLPDAAAALAKVPFVAVMAGIQAKELERAHLVLPAAMWAEVDGTFTNYQRRVQRIRRAVPAPGSAVPRWELAAGLLRRLGSPLTGGSAGDLFAQAARAVPDYGELSHQSLGATGRALPLRDGETAAASKASV